MNRPTLQEFERMVQKIEFLFMAMNDLLRESGSLNEQAEVGAVWLTVDLITELRSHEENLFKREEP